MLTLFSPKEKITNLIQILNLIALGAALNRLITDPKANKLEVGFKILTHLMNLSGQKRKLGSLATLGFYGWNSTRLLGVLAGEMLNASTLSTAENMNELLLGFANMLNVSENHHQVEPNTQAVMRG